MKDEKEPTNAELHAEIRELRDLINTLYTDVQPVVEAYKAATLSSSFIVKFAQFLLTLGVFGGAIMFVLKGIGKW